MAASTATPTMPAMVTPVPGYGYQGSAAGAEPPAHSSSGSVGTFFGVLAAVLLLTLLSCVFGRVCAGRAEGPDERFDCSRLARRWCGRRAPAPRRAAVKREAKAPPVMVVEVPAAALPPPEEP